MKKGKKGPQKAVITCPHCRTSLILSPANIRRAMNERDISQGELADMLGIHTGNLGKLLNGRRSMLNLELWKVLVLINTLWD